MNLKDALYHAVHDYDGGVAALAARMGVAPSTLYSMANPNEASHPWSMERAMQVVAFTGDHRVLQSICEAGGGVFVPVAPVSGGLATVSERMLKLSAEFGDVARTVHDSIGDGRLTPHERDHVAKQLYELIAAAAQLGQVLDAQVEAGRAFVKAVK